MQLALERSLDELRSLSEQSPALARLADASRSAQAFLFQTALAGDTAQLSLCKRRRRADPVAAVGSNHLHGALDPYHGAHPAAVYETGQSNSFSVFDCSLSLNVDLPASRRVPATPRRQPRLTSSQPKRPIMLGWKVRFSESFVEDS